MGLQSHRQQNLANKNKTLFSDLHFFNSYYSPPRRKKCLYSEFFWFVFSGIRTECGDLRSKSIVRPNGGKYAPEKLRIWTLFTQYNYWLYFFLILLKTCPFALKYVVHFSLIFHFLTPEKVRKSLVF